MPYVNLPPGCKQLAFADGGRPAVGDRAGGRAEVSDSRARMIDQMSGNGDAGLVGRATFHEFTTGTRAGRWCTTCQPARLWNAWNQTCPRCGAATEPEQAPAQT